MRHLLFCLLLALPVSSWAAELTIERLEASPSLNGPSIAGLKLSPDGERVTFLKGKDEDFRVQDLWEYYIPTGETRLLVDSRVLLGGTEETLSEVEKARRERQRIRASGIVEYAFSKDGSMLLFPLNGDLYVLPIGGTARRITETDAFETDARFSPMGNYVSFVRRKNLFVFDLNTGTETALSTEGGGHIAIATAEFVAQEEMDRDTGYWWAPDESRIALTRIDESGVDLLHRYEMDARGKVTTIDQRYPAAGTPNVAIDLGWVDVGTGAFHWIDLGAEEDIYLARVAWSKDSKTLAYQRESRDQQHLDLVFVDAESGDQRVVLTEESSTWLNLDDGPRFLEQGSGFLWTSERDGYRRVYRYDERGDLVGALTPSGGVVERIAGVDEEHGWLYVLGNFDGVLERHLYRTSSSPDSRMERLTASGGWHEVTLDDGAEHFLDRFSSPSQPPQVVLRRIDGTAVAVIQANDLDADHPYFPYLESRPTLEFGTLEADDGTTLHYSLRKPHSFDSSSAHPAVVSVYGGPGAQRVARRWDLGFDEILARNGFVVLRLDNRGSANRGKAFEDPIHHHLGGVEVRDQVRGAQFLARQPWIDADRIGVYGWSYGGFMTVQLLAQASDTFVAGVSIAPVTDWRLYDTHYTERYLGLPDQSDAYDLSSVFPYLDGLRSGALRLVHGMADDNVFFDNSVRLMSELQTRGVSFELMTYPGKRHGIRGQAARTHLWKDTLDFFDRKLKN